LVKWLGNELVLVGQNGNDSRDSLPGWTALSPLSCRLFAAGKTGHGWDHG